MRGSLGSLTFSSRRARANANLGGAIYGTITVAAVIAASAAHDEPLTTVLAATVSTVVVFWLAHVYSEVIAHHFEGHRPSLAAVAHVAHRELPFLEAPVLPILLLVAGAAGFLDHDVAINLALWTAVLQLAGWGVASARRQGWSWPAAAVTGAINGAFGMVLILLKAILH
jgi:hypothetical protein